MKEFKKIQERRGYGHIGMTVELDLNDEVIIANEIQQLSMAKSSLSAFYNEKETFNLHDIPAIIGAIDRLLPFLNKLTRIKLEESELFQDAEESSGARTDADE